MPGRRVESTVAGPAALPRWILLVLLAFGVAGMHTFGHVGGGHAGGGAHSASAHREPAAPLPLLVPDTGPDRLVDTDGGDDRDPGVHAFDVCLAVLGAVGLVVAVALVGRARRRRTPDTAVRPAVRSPGRGPPVHRLGLRLSVVSVLRI